MAAGKYNLVIDQGSDFALQLTIKEDNVPKDITGYSARAQLRKTIKNPDIAATFTCTIVDAANGVIKMELPNTTSAGISEGIYYYDLEIFTAGDNQVVRLMQGKVTVTPEVTR